MIILFFKVTWVVTGYSNPTIPQEKTLFEESLLSKGYCVDTVSLNPETIRNYVQYQEAREREKEKKRLIVNSP